MTNRNGGKYSEHLPHIKVGIRGRKVLQSHTCRRMRPSCDLARASPECRALSRCIRLSDRPETAQRCLLLSQPLQ